MSSKNCPFPGLLPFQEKDAPFFFGRDLETAELLQRLERSRFMAVIGVSGSGKSSLVHAGLKPELRLANPPWRIVEMKPGSGPRRRLQSALETVSAAVDWDELLGKSSYGLVDGIEKVGLEAGEKVLVIVDQFEEVFSYRNMGHREAEEADLFVQQILRASANPGAPVCVMLTMRTDYLGHCALFRNLPEALNEGTYLVPRLTREEQHEAIRSPLAVSGVEIEPELVDLLLNAAEANRDELPVLQHLLKRLWEGWEARGRQGNIARKDYENAGGWDEAIAKDAASVLDPLGATERDAVKLVFQRITEKGTGERSIRTPCPLVELNELTRALVGPGRLRDILVAFRARDLLVWDSEERIDIPHECITWRWTKLAEWIEDEDRDKRRLAFIAESGRSRTPLAGSALEEARAMRGRIAGPWVRRYSLDVGELTQWIDHSERAATRARQRTRNLVIGLVLATLLFAFLGLWALQQKSRADLGETEAREQSELALARLLAAESELVLAEDPLRLEKPTLLAAQSMRQRPTFEGDLALRRSAKLLPRTRLELKDKYPLHAVAISPDGKWLVTATREGVRMMDVATGKQGKKMFFRDRESPVEAVALSLDGRLVALGSENGTARIVDIATGQEVPLPYWDRGNVLAFSPDGKLVAIGHGKSALRVMDARTGQEVAQVPSLERLRLHSVAFSRNRKLVAMGFNIGWRVIDLASGSTVGECGTSASSVYALAFSPDGKWVATGIADNTARVWKAAASCEEVFRLDYKGDVRAVAFSPDGNWVATGSDDNTARLIEAATGREMARVTHEDVVRSIAFTADGKWLVTGSHDQTARMVETPTDKLAHVLDGLSPLAVAVSPDGKWMAIGSYGTADVINLTTGTRRSVYLGGVGLALDSVAFSPDSKWIACGSSDDGVRMLEIETGNEVSRVPSADGVNQVAFSPDGNWVSAVSRRRVVMVIQAATGKEVARLPELDGVSATAVSPDGKRVAVAGEGGLRVILLATKKEVCNRRGLVDSVAFSPDGKRVAVAGPDGVWVIDARTGNEVSHFALEQARLVSFSPDGKRVAFGSGDTVRVMDSATGQEMRRIELQGKVLNVSFSKGGEWLEIVYHDRRTFAELRYSRHPLEPEELIREACEKVTRNLTLAEWKQYAGPEIPYRRTCDNLPLPPDYRPAR